jgi:hypothetical protein
MDNKQVPKKTKRKRKARLGRTEPFLQYRNSQIRLNRDPSRADILDYLLF